ncbi:S8 family serine peptidase [Mycoplasmopsis gallinarum]
MKIKNKFKFAFLSVLSFITVFFSSSKINYQLSLPEVKIQIKETNSINENKRDINNNSNNDNRKKLLYNSSHQEQFDLVNYSKEARIANINKFKNKDEKINVGILEVGDEKGHRNALINAKDIDYFDNNIYKIDVYNNWRWKTGYSEHATKVASIAGGYEGVNPNINLYGQWFDDDDDFEDEIRYFKSKNVKVINMSFGKKYHDNIDLEYNVNSAKLDKIAQENPEIIFVLSAGNDGFEQFHQLNNWKLANNVLIVGSTDNGKNSAIYSSYDSYTDRQITLLAPGLYYKNGIPFNGTSFAAPFITGIISLTLQKYPKVYDKGKNNIIAISALLVST